MLPVLEEMLHVVVVSKEFENEGFSGVLKDQPELESNPGFVPVVTEFAQSNPAVQMRLPKAPLRLRDSNSRYGHLRLLRCPRFSVFAASDTLKGGHQTSQSSQNENCCLRDGLSHHLALCGRQGADGLEQSGMDADGVQAKVLGSNLPLKVA